MVQQPYTLATTQVKIELVAEKSAGKCCDDDTREKEVSLVCKKARQDETCFTFQESPEEQDPVPVHL